MFKIVSEIDCDNFKRFYDGEVKINSYSEISDVYYFAIIR